MKTLELIFSAVLLLCVSSGSLFAANADYLTYDRFIAEVEAGSVKTVSLNRFSQIAGTHAVDGTVRPFTCYGDTGSANDVLLTRLLQQKGVAVTLEPQKERSMFGDSVVGLLILALPAVTLLVALRINYKLNRLPK